MDATTFTNFDHKEKVKLDDMDGKSLQLPVDLTESENCDLTQSSFYNFYCRIQQPNDSDPMGSRISTIKFLQSGWNMTV